jgi:iron(III) transport system substrate-binding protein
MKAVLAACLAAWLTFPALAADTPAPVDVLYAELARLPAAERTKRIEQGAMKEGRLDLVHTWRGPLARNHVALFKKRYPFLSIDFVDIGSQDAGERFVAEETAGRHLTDIFSMAVPDLSEVLKQRLAATYPTPATGHILPAYHAFIDPDNRWVPYYWSEHGLSYNTDLVKGHAPKGWFDLCDPYFKGNASYDPGELRFMTGLYAMLGAAETERLIKCIGANQPIISRGHEQRMTLMLAGDHMMQGDNYLYQGELAKRKDPSTPFAIVDGAPVLGFAGAMVINKNAPHPYAAALLADWALSEESQQYTAQQFRGPVAIKHPYLPEDAQIVPYGDTPPDLAEMLQGWWAKYVRSK